MLKVPAEIVSVSNSQALFQLNEIVSV